MKITLPAIKKEMVGDDINVTEYENEFDLDMSLASQLRYEAKFPALAKNEDLIGYTQRISKVEDLSAAVIISKMKTLYCYLETEMTFVDFLRMFDLTDEKYIKKLTDKIKFVFELVLNSSAEKN